MLAVDDAMYNRFSSTRAIWSVMEKHSVGPEKVLEFVSKQESGNPGQLSTLVSATLITHTD